MKHETRKTVTNRRVDNILKSNLFYKEHKLCIYCPVYGGCNWKNPNAGRPNRNWKRYRKHQWK